MLLPDGHVVLWSSRSLLRAIHLSWSGRGVNVSRGLEGEQALLFFTALALVGLVRQRRETQSARSRTAECLVFDISCGRRYGGSCGSCERCSGGGVVVVNRQGCCVAQAERKFQSLALRNAAAAVVVAVRFRTTSECNIAAQSTIHGTSHAAPPENFTPMIVVYTPIELNSK